MGAGGGFVIAIRNEATIASVPERRKAYEAKPPRWWVGSICVSANGCGVRCASPRGGAADVAHQGTAVERALGGLACRKIALDRVGLARPPDPR